MYYTEIQIQIRFAHIQKEIKLLQEGEILEVEVI
jgi:hypothetical protein